MQRYSNLSAAGANQPYTMFPMVSATGITQALDKGVPGIVSARWSLSARAMRVASRKIFTKLTPSNPPVRPEDLPFDLPRTPVRFIATALIEDGFYLSIMADRVRIPSEVLVGREAMELSVTARAT